MKLQGHYMTSYFFSNLKGFKCSDQPDQDKAYH